MTDRPIFYNGRRIGTVHAYELDASHETDDGDEALRERYRQRERAPDMLQVVLGCAAVLADPPCSLRGETLGPGYVRIYAGGDMATIVGLQAGLREQLSATWLVEVWPEATA